MKHDLEQWDVKEEVMERVSLGYCRGWFRYRLVFTLVRSIFSVAVKAFLLTHSRPSHSQGEVMVVSG